MSTTSFDLRVPVTCSLPHIGRRLANGASVIIIEDKASTKPAAAMSIAVGSNNDPVDFPGLAHFCEHMLFMGTAKYPSEDAYGQAVSRSGGYSNAWTGDDVTTYYYTSSLDSYKGLLEMFLDFFIAPSFNTSAVDREINAVHSEDQKNHAVDYWRLDELYRSFFDEKHPRLRYGNGNLTTLKEEPEAKGLRVHDALKGFFKQNYVAAGSTLVLYSPYSADELMALVEPILGNMQVGPNAPQSFLPAGTLSPIRPSALQKWYNVITSSKKRQVRLSWVIPYGRRHWKSMPYAYVSHLIGHEVKGSVLAALREKNLATDLSGGSAGSVDNDFMQFIVDVTLTDEGLQRIPDVLYLVFQYLELIRRAGSVSSEAYSELKKEQLAVFEFAEVGAPDGYSSGVSNRGSKMGAEFAVVGGSIFLEDRPEEAIDVLKYLTSDTCVVTLKAGEEEVFKAAAAAGAFAGKEDLDQVTRFHGMKYSVSPIPEVMLQAWSNASLAKVELDPLLALPAPNPYLSDNFTVYSPPGDSIAPTRVEMKYGYALVKRNEAHLSVPKTHVTVNLLLTNNDSIAATYYRAVMKEIIDEALVDTLYFASLAGVNFSGSVGFIGYTVSSTGPSESVPKFVLLVLKSILDLKFLRSTAEVFQRQKRHYELALVSKKEEQPYLQTMALLSTFLGSDQAYGWEEILDFSPKATYEGYVAFVNSFLEAARAEVVIDGNLQQISDASTLLLGPLDELLEASGAHVAPAADLPPFRDFYTPKRIGKGELLLVNHTPFSEANVNASATVRLQAGEASPERDSFIEVLSNLMSAHFFNTLRGTEALGYVVASQSGVTHYREAHFLFLAQSSLVGPLYLYSRIHAFIDAFEKQVLEPMAQSEVDTAVIGLIQSRKALTTSVANDGSRAFGDRLSPYGYDWRAKEIAVLERGVTKEQLLNLYREVISNNSDSRRGVAVFVNSASLPEEGLDYSSAVQLPAMKKSIEVEKNDEEAVADTKLVMNTFAEPTSVKFSLIDSKAATRNASDRHTVNIL